MTPKLFLTEEKTIIDERGNQVPLPEAKARLDLGTHVSGNAQMDELIDNDYSMGEV